MLDFFDDFSDYLPGLACGLLLVVCIAIGCSVIVLPTYFAADHACAKRAEMLETEYKYGFWQGCWVKAEGKWVEYSTIRNVEVK